MSSHSTSSRHLPYWIKILLLLLVLLIIGVASSALRQKKEKPAIKHNINKAICILSSTEGSVVTGKITFIKTKNRIRMIADVEGLTPGKHGIHIHEFGDCQAPDASGAGPHFNPEGMPHGGPTNPIRHVGDLGNLFAGPSGKAHLEYTNSKLSFKGENNIIGRSVIIHQNEDNFITQPDGNAGVGLACGIIGIDG